MSVQTLLPLQSDMVDVGMCFPRALPLPFIHIHKGEFREAGHLCETHCKPL